MKLEKAIEILEDYKMQSAFEATPDFEDALKLGIEALKLVLEQGLEYYLVSEVQLPGETKE